MDSGSQHFLRELGSGFRITEFQWVNGHSSCSAAVLCLVSRKDSQWLGDMVVEENVKLCAGGAGWGGRR